MTGAAICAGLVMLFVLVCAVIAILVVVAKKRSAPQPPQPLWCVDPEQPGQAINEAGQLVATPKDRP